MSFLDILRAFVPLILILGLLLGFLYLAKKYSFSIGGKRPRNLNVDVLHSQLILPKKYISLVRVQDKVFVLGVSDTNITLLKELEYSSFNDDSGAPADVKQQSFVEIFKQNLGMK